VGIGMLSPHKPPVLSIALLVGALILPSSSPSQFVHNLYQQARAIGNSRTNQTTPSDSSALPYYTCISVGMGLTYISAPDIVAYINSIAMGQEAKNLTATAEFFVAPELQISRSLGITLEYAYLMVPYNLEVRDIGSYRLTYSVHMPSIILDYLVFGDRYYLKFGGGLGYHFGFFTREFPNDESYSAGGIGFKLEAAGNTSLGGRVYALIAADLRGDFVRRLKDKDGNYIVIRRPYDTDENARLGFLSVSVKFGLTYHF
jgi:hypothetical protein